MIAHPFRRIVWPLGVAETLVWATTYYMFPALLPAWEADLGWSKADLSAGFTLALVASALLAPLAGRLIDHGHGRAVLAGGALLAAAMLGMLSQVTALWQFILIWIGIGVAQSGTLYEAAFALLTRTMGAQAKRAITLVTLVAGFAGTISFPSAHGLVEVVGWRGTLLVFAAVALFLTMPLMWWASGAARGHSQGSAPAPSSRFTETLGILRRPAIWFLGFAFAMIALDHGMVISHLLPILDDRGLHPEAAVLAAAMIGPMQVAGRLAMMAGERYVSTLAIACCCYLSLGLAAAALLGASILPGLVVAFVLFQGAGAGVSSIMRPVVVAELLGRRNFGVIAGLLAVPYVSGSAAAPTVAALVWQAGGYDRVLQLAIGLATLGLLALLAAWRTTGAKTPKSSPPKAR